ncbi:MAG TPA: hypothetical protein VF121_16295 [Thermoanaerobaculia bacterium]|nr:hypothetical protein [Thermoanaerobaculia bacterium]
MPYRHHWIVPTAGAMLLASALAAQAPEPADRPIDPQHRAWIVFKDGGKVVSVGEWRIKPPLLIFRGDTGTLLSARLDRLDFGATRRLNGVPPPLPTAAVELKVREHKLTPQEEWEIRREAQENVAIENSLTPAQREERARIQRGIRKFGEELRCIARSESGLEREICRLRVEIAYRP